MPEIVTAPPSIVPGHGLLLAAVRKTCKQLWNSVHINADEKRKASAYYEANQDDAHKLYALNKRMSEMILSRTPKHQRA